MRDKPPHSVMYGTGKPSLRQLTPVTPKDCEALVTAFRERFSGQIINVDFSDLETRALMRLEQDRGDQHLKTTGGFE